MAFYNERQYCRSQDRGLTSYKCKRNRNAVELKSSTQQNVFYNCHSVSDKKPRCKSRKTNYRCNYSQFAVQPASFQKKQKCGCSENCRNNLIGKFQYSKKKVLMKKKFIKIIKYIVMKWLNISKEHL